MLDVIAQYLWKSKELGQQALASVNPYVQTYIQPYVQTYIQPYVQTYVTPYLESTGPLLHSSYWQKFLPDRGPHKVYVKKMRQGAVMMRGSGPSRMARSDSRRNVIMVSSSPRKAKWKEWFILVLALFVAAYIINQSFLLFSEIHVDVDDVPSHAHGRKGHRTGRRGSSDPEEPLSAEERRRLIEPPKSVPEDFVWHTYLRLHPDLVVAGINSERAAKTHFKDHGRLEGRPYKLPRVYLQYTACTTLTEQIYSHMAAMVIGSKLGPAELVFAPGVGRDEQGWLTLDPDTLFDIEKMNKHWQKDFDVKMTIAKSNVQDLPDGFAEVSFDKIFPAARDPDLPDESVLQLDGLHHQLRTIRRVADTIYQKIGMKQMAAGAGFDDQFQVLVQLPCTFWTLRTDSCYHSLEQKVLPSLEFNANVQKLATRIIKKLKPFDGIIIHNITEHKAFTTTQKQETLRLYMKDMKKYFAGHSCYVAAEVTDLRDTDVDHMNELLVDANLCNDVRHKGHFLTPRELRQLNSEQHALLDMLVMMEADQLVGSYYSLFTLFVREYRYIRRQLPRNTVTRVNDSTVDHEYLPSRLFYGGLLSEPDKADKIGVEALPFLTHHTM